MLKKKYHIVIKTILAIFLLSSTGYANVLEDAKEYNGHYYKIFDFQVAWKDAKKFCESVGGHLATIETQGEYDVINELVKNGSLRDFGYWLGGYRTSNGLWKWIDGKLITGNHWASGYPTTETLESANNLKTYYYNDVIKSLWVNPGFYDGKENGLVCEWESVNDAHDPNM